MATGDVASARVKPRPLRGFINMMSEMERVRNLGRTGRDPGQPGDFDATASAWSPTTDIVGRGQSLVISTELAGVPAADVDISVADGVLTISGERQDDNDEDITSTYLRERQFGPFRRSMVLPDGVDEKAITAAYDNGVVTITVPDALSSGVAASHRVQIAQG
ncbi:MAG: Hsp20/alpha crystallin family protein [Nocardioidaceae bacterium]